MVLRPRSLSLLALASLLVLAGSQVRAEEAPRTAQVTLELKDYLALVQSAERAARERAQQAANRTEPLAEVVSQKTRVVIGDGMADVEAELEVLVVGHPKSNLLLPARVVATKGSVEARTAPAASGGKPGAVLTAAKNQVFLVPLEPGRYGVRLSGSTKLTRNGGASRYLFAPIAAPVAVAEVDLPADLAWSAPGAVVVDERVAGGRRRVQISAKRGESPAFEVRRKLDGSDAEKLLARAVVLTLFQLGPEGAQRHDVVLYEVSRGSLASFTVDLPPGLEVERAGTDEGEMVAAVEARRLTFHRRRHLQGTGYLVLSSTPDPKGELTLQPLLPGVEVRARYLAVSSTIASEAKPLPEGDWSRVDLEDLPPQVGRALADLAPTAAWRLAEEAGKGSPAEARKLLVARVQPAPVLPAVVRSRSTTTILTVDGTVLHRDLLTLLPVPTVAAALDLTLPAGGTLWSVKVDDLAVRPLERNGRVTVPLGFSEGREPVVEVVSVLEKAIPRGRSDLALELPRIAAPVQEHQWRLLLPEGASYRFAGGDLRPVPLRRQPEGRRRASLAVAKGGGDKAADLPPEPVQGLYGLVQDEQGSPLPGVTVTIRDVARNRAPMVQITNADGRFRFPGLVVGFYELRSELEGFAPIEVPRVTVDPYHAARVDMTLSAAVQDVITVTGETAVEDDQGPIARRRREGGKPKDRDKEAKEPAVWSVDGLVLTDMTAIGSAPTYYDFDAFEEMQTTVADLKSGLVGGVRSLPLTIPESGKVFVMAGLLPPERVAVELEVKGQR